MIDLKPCPFCGNKKIILDTVANIEGQDEDHEDYAYNSGIYMACCPYDGTGCGTSSGGKFSKEEAAEAWNRRAKNGTTDL